MFGDVPTALLVFISFGIFSASSMVVLLRYFEAARDASPIRWRRTAVSIAISLLIFFDCLGLAGAGFLFFSSVDRPLLVMGIAVCVVTFFAVFKAGRWLLRQKL